jgi:hypothetical protein
MTSDRPPVRAFRLVLTTILVVIACDTRHVVDTTSAARPLVTIISKSQPLREGMCDWSSEWKDDGTPEGTQEGGKCWETKEFNLPVEKGTTDHEIALTHEIRPNTDRTAAVLRLSWKIQPSKSFAHNPPTQAIIYEDDSPNAEENLASEKSPELFHQRANLPEDVPQTFAAEELKFGRFYVYYFVINTFGDTRSHKRVFSEKLEKVIKVDLRQ